MERYIGQILNGRYQINEIIGVGGMAVVYKAYDHLLARNVAVKILKDEYMKNEEFRHRFTLESKAITLLSHKNIVDIYDVSLDGDILFIAMEYLDGVTLKEYIDSVGVLEWHEGTHYIKQILSAVQHAHERGVVHRDLKPQNIMLLQDGTIKVMDFGIAQVSDFETQTLSDEALGSVHYISPEQASGDALDERTDIYAIGIMLYQFVTGSLPFDGDNAVSVALMQIQEQPVLPRDLNENIPVGLEQIILKAMMKNPADRYAEASDMLADIERIEGNPNYIFHFDEYAQVDFPQPSVSEQIEETEETDELAEPQEDAPLTKAQKRKLSTKLPIAGGVVAAFLAFVLVAIGMFVWPDVVAETTYEVPNLTDKIFDEVVGDDAYAHFKIVKKGEKPSEKKKGTILSQTIAEFTMVKDGTEIGVYVSSGVETIPLPDVIGKSESEAKEIFDSNSIPFQVVRIYSDSVKEGYVVRTSIAAGDEVNLASDTVTMYVSRGSSQDSVRVPDLYGKTEKEAKAALEELKLKLNATVYEEYSDTLEKGMIVRQAPAFGTSVSKGTSVTIYVSKGKDPEKEKEQTASVSVTITFDKSYTDQTMKISIKQGNTVLSAQNVAYSSLSKGVFTWTGTAKIGEVVTVSVDDAVQHTMTVSSGLNSAKIKMSSGGYVEPPQYGDVSVSITFDESYTDQTVIIRITEDGTVLESQTLPYSGLTDGTYTWSGSIKVGATVVVSVDGAVQKELTVKEGSNDISVSMSSGSYVPPEPVTPTT